MQKRNSRLKTAVRRAVAEHGGRLSTADAALAVYPHKIKAGLPLNKSAYHYLRTALKEIATPIGRSDQHPGRPWLWQATPDFDHG